MQDINLGIKKHSYLTRYSFELIYPKRMYQVIHIEYNVLVCNYDSVCLRACSVCCIYVVSVYVQSILLRMHVDKCDASMKSWIIHLRMRRLSFDTCPHANEGMLLSLQWRHNGRDGVSNHQPHDCLLNRLFRRRSKKTPKLRVTGLCEWNSPVAGELSAQMASNAENISIWWCHHVW